MLAENGDVKITVPNGTQNIQNHPFMANQPTIGLIILSHTHVRIKCSTVLHLHAPCLAGDMCCGAASEAPDFFRPTDPTGNPSVHRCQ